MIIICPNCYAEYSCENKSIGTLGRNVRCSQCSQEWFQYNFEESGHNIFDEENPIKKLAHAEYLISINEKSNLEQNFSTAQTDDLETRVHKSPKRLKDTKNANRKVRELEPNHAEIRDNYTILGFGLISLVCVFLTIFYISNDQLKLAFPTWHNYLDRYKDWVNILIQSTRSLKQIITSYFH